MASVSVSLFRHSGRGLNLTDILFQSSARLQGLCHLHSSTGRWAVLGDLSVCAPFFNPRPGPYHTQPQCGCPSYLTAPLGLALCRHIIPKACVGTEVAM